MTAIDLDHVLTVLGAQSWAEAEQRRAEVAARLALIVYDGHVRDQGTPYLEHPLGVVAILRNEIGADDADTLVLALLHDALEVAPESSELLAWHLGADFTTRLRSMTPDHRLEGRPKCSGDELGWREKQAGLPPGLLLVRLADRVHNLRDLVPGSARRERFLRTLRDFYLPLADEAADRTPHLAALRTLLHAEYDRHRQEPRP
ncbi:HD domain-containing protein [Streptomyces sp. GZWMJZ-114]|uniref:HD domain-containing protein n=1 Tax=Streptomyces sp. GZWMJZ-114 TaxID=2494734 RepID=UPI001013846A|nr:HD domain-containing protein [Streptomyces sp. GZWMJZ-114]